MRADERETVAAYAYRYITEACKALLIPMRATVDRILEFSVQRPGSGISENDTGSTQSMNCTMKELALKLYLDRTVMIARVVASPVERQMLQAQVESMTARYFVELNGIETATTSQDLNARWDVFSTVSFVLNEKARKSMKLGAEL